MASLASPHASKVGKPFPYNLSPPPPLERFNAPGKKSSLVMI